MAEKTDGIDRLFENPANRAVLAFLANQSAHSDVAEELARAAAPLGDVQTDCPNWAEYRYVVASTRDIVFAFAIGQDTIGFRTGPLTERAVRTGAGVVPGLDGWAAFTLFRPAWPKPDLPFWALKAYALARAG